MNKVKVVVLVGRGHLTYIASLLIKYVNVVHKRVAHTSELRTPLHIDHFKVSSTIILLIKLYKTTLIRNILLWAGTSIMF